MPLWLWFVYLVAMGGFVALDLGLLSRRPTVISAREAGTGLLIWLVAAVAVGVGLAAIYRGQFLGTELGDLRDALSQPIDNRVVDGPTAFLQYITGYAVELSLSLDNLAILALLLTHFRIPAPFIARAIFWAMAASLVMRLGLIQAGGAALAAYAWIPYAFGGLLVLAMLRTLLMPDANADVSKTLLVRTVRLWLPVARECDGQRLTTVIDGRRRLTPIAALAIAYALADLTFALDSIPAVFAVTKDPFIAFASNAMAILALRSLYALLSGVGGRVRYVKVSVVFVLLWVAAKMFVEDYRKVDTVWTLAVVTGVTTMAVVASVIHDRVSVRVRTGSWRAHRPAPVHDLAEAALASRRHLRKMLVLIVGTAIVLVGIAIVGPLPGPGGIPVVLAGLGLLATEFIWAQRMLQKVKQQAADLQQRTDQMAEQASPWMIPVVFGIYWGGVYLLATWLYRNEWNKSGTFVWLASIGVFLPIAYWAFGVVRALIRARRAARAGPDPGAPKAIGPRQGDSGPPGNVPG